MRSKADRRIEAAKGLEERLKKAGLHSDALIVAELRRSLSSARGTLKIAARDNINYRRQLGLPTFPEKGEENDETGR